MNHGPPLHEAHSSANYCNICHHFYHELDFPANVKNGLEPNEWSQTPEYHFAYETPQLAWNVDTDPYVMWHLSANEQVFVHNVLTFVIRCKHFFKDCEDHGLHDATPSALKPILAYDYNVQTGCDLEWLLADAIHILNAVNAPYYAYARQFVLGSRPAYGANPMLMSLQRYRFGNDNQLIDDLNTLLQHIQNIKHDANKQAATAQRLQQEAGMRSGASYTRPYNAPLLQYLSSRPVESIAFNAAYNQRDSQLLGNLKTFVERSKTYLTQQQHNGQLSSSDVEFLRSLQMFGTYDEVGEGVPHLVEHARRLLDRCSRPFNPQNEDASGFRSEDVRRYILQHANPALLQAFPYPEPFIQRMNELMQVNALANRLLQDA